MTIIKAFSGLQKELSNTDFFIKVPVIFILAHQSLRCKSKVFHFLKTFQYYVFCLCNNIYFLEKCKSGVVWGRFYRCCLVQATFLTGPTNSTYPLYFFPEPPTFAIFWWYCPNETQDKHKIKTHEGELFLHK